MRLWLTFYLFFLVSTAAIAVPGPGEAVRPDFQDGSRIRVFIKKKVQIEKDVVMLGDVADISALTDKEKRELQGIIITTFTGDKNKITVPGKYIRSRIEEVIKVPISDQFKIPEHVEIELVKRNLQSSLIEKLERLVRSRSAVPKDIEIEISDLSKGAKEITEKELDSVPIEPVHRKTFWRGRTFFSIDREKGDRILFSARIRWFGKRWIAKRTISRGSELKSEDFELERVEVLKNKDDSVRAKDQSELVALIRNSSSRNVIPAKGVLRNSHIANDPDSTAGSIVKVQLINDGGLRLSTSGKLLRSTRIGDMAHVKIFRTGKIVDGVLLRGGTVEIRE